MSKNFKKHSGLSFLEYWYTKNDIKYIFSSYISRRFIVKTEIKVRVHLDILQRSLFFLFFPILSISILAFLGKCLSI